jgi:hypothetical protein
MREVGSDQGLQENELLKSRNYDYAQPSRLEFVSPMGIPNQKGLRESNSVQLRAGTYRSPAAQAASGR